MDDFGFKYDNVTTKSLGLVLSKSSSENNSAMSREILKGEMTQYNSLPYHYGTKYSDVLTLNFGLVKNPCLTDYDPGFTESEIRKIYKWLTAYTLPMPLITDKSDIEYWGVFSDVNPIYAGTKIVGIDTVFKCSSPFGIRSNSVTLENESSVGTTDTFTIESDDGDFVYPKIVFTAKESGTFKIRNTKIESTKYMTMTCVNNYVYTIDCKRKTVTEKNTSDVIRPMTLAELGVSPILDNNDVSTGVIDMFWLKLDANGDNVLEFTGKGDYTINYEEKLKVGGLYV